MKKLQTWTYHFEYNRVSREQEKKVVAVFKRVEKNKK